VVKKVSKVARATIGFLVFGNLIHSDTRSLLSVCNSNKQGAGWWAREVCARCRGV